MNKYRRANKQQQTICRGLRITRTASLKNAADQQLQKNNRYRHDASIASKKKKWPCLAVCFAMKTLFVSHSLYIYSCPAGFKRIPIYTKQGFNSATPSISIITLNRGLYIYHQTIYFVLSLLLFNLTRIYTRYIKETREILTHTHVIDCIQLIYIGY